MSQNPSFGVIVRERRKALGLTQTELARRVGCAPVTIRKIEYDALRPSVQIAEYLAVALNIPEAEQLAFVRLARMEREPAAIPTPPPALEEIGQKNLSGRAIKGFELGERIGTGGYGVVYRANQVTIEREVAVKVILPDYANRPEFIRRFEAEARLVARLEHPHIVPLYDYWREPGVAYLVMRLLRGGSLEGRLTDGPLPFESLLSLLEQICAGLYTAHRAGVIHRDIKPANILLDEEGNAYLADFGIAKHIGNGKAAEKTLEGTVIGSPAYISPEQILSEPVKPQTDIYSLGVMLYELLTGRKPFKGPTPFAYIQQHLNKPLPLLSATQNGDDALAETEQSSSAPAASHLRSTSSTGQAIPTALDIVIGRATAKEPRDRYPDILSMLADLRRALQPGSAAADLAKSQGGEATPPHVAHMLDLPDLENPYKGLRPFTEADAANFFGREALVQDLLARLSETHDLARFLAVVGPSGSGKSSVVRAGLIPALRRGGLPGSDNWFITEMLPGPHPLKELEAALLRVAISPPESLLAQLRQDERGLLQAIRRILPVEEAGQGDENHTELVLVIDQFEELFTLVQDEAARTHFLDSLVTATLDPDSRLRLVITLRADFTDQPLRYVDFGELLRSRTEFVLPLTLDELEQAIVEPTEQVGLTLEPGLVTTIIRVVGDQPGTLPLLQYALTELFERREGRRLTLAAYQESGGVPGALARRADELYEGLDETGQMAARQLFLRLVMLGEGTEDTRRRVLRAELAGLTPQSPSLEEKGESDTLSPVGNGATGTPPHVGKEGLGEGSVMASVIDLYGRYRLLTFDHDPLTRSPTVEVAHEALLRQWDQLRQWLDASRVDVRLQRLLASAASEWTQAGRDPGFLLRGARLDQFETWATNTELALTYDERTFLRTGLAARRARRIEEQVRQRRELETAQKLAKTEKVRAEEQVKANFRLRWLAAGLALFLLLAVAGAWFAFNQRNVAQTNAARAEDNFVTSERIRLAAQAQIALDNGESGDLPALLALRSLQHGYSPEADAALLGALSRGFTRQRYVGHTDAVRDAVFSQDGRYVLTASADNTTRLWNAQTGRELHKFTGHTQLVNAAEFSPDSLYVLTGSIDGTVRLWDTQTGRELRQFTGHDGGVTGTAFSPDGQTIVTAGYDKTVRLWDVETGRELRQFLGHADLVSRVDFSPDGRYIATASADQTARLWHVETGQELRQFLGHTDDVGTARFSPDGQYLITESADLTARLWDVQTGLEMRRFVGHTALLNNVAFSPDGQYVLTGSFDKTARLWDVTTNRELRQFIGHTGGVSPVAFSPDGRYVLTGSLDRTARLWDLRFETEPRTLDISLSAKESSGFHTAALSPDSRTILTGGQAFGASVVRLWDVQSGGFVREIMLDLDTINDLTLSPDGRYILTGSGDNISRLWDAETGQKVRQFSGHTSPILDVAFSADGRHVLTGSEDQTARLWDTDTGQEVARFAGHTGPVVAISISSNGDHILTGSEDQTARLWDAETGQELRQLMGHSGPVLDVAISAGDRVILTGSGDNTARLWDAESGQEMVQLTGHTDQVIRVAFSPDGRYALTGSADQTARLWEVQTGRNVRQLVGHASRLLFVGFSATGQQILTSDTQSTFVWRLALEEVIDFTCAQLSRDFTAKERDLYNIVDDAPTCPELAERIATVQPTWTPVPKDAIPVETLALEVSAQPTPEVIEVVFLNDAANLLMGAPMQDVFIEAGDGLVARPQNVRAPTVAQPLYRATELIEPDFLEEPFEVGPFEMGEPLGFTLEEWLAATGQGTYTVSSNRAVLELSFEKLVPNGVYTLWCSELHLPPNTEIIDRPCGAPDGSDNSFMADEAGNLALTLEIDTVPPAPDGVIYPLALAYHSDGQTWGAHPGDFGYNLHVQLFFEFPRPEN